MEAVLITVYLIIVVALIAVILLQRSEGGGLGMGGNPSGLMTVRGSANLLTRTTAVLAALFFATAIGLTILSELDRGTQGILQKAADSVGEGAGDTTVLDALNALQPQDNSLAVPQTNTTAPAETTAPAADASAPAADTAPTDTQQPAATQTPAAPVN